MFSSKEYREMLLQFRTRDSTLGLKELLSDPHLLSRQKEISLSRRYEGEDYLGGNTDYLGQRYRGKVSRLFYSSSSRN